MYSISKLNNIGCFSLAIKIKDEPIYRCTVTPDNLEDIIAKYPEVEGLIKEKITDEHLANWRKFKKEKEV